MEKGSKIYSILKRKCPQCQEGEFFEGNYFNGKVKEKCDSCGLKYRKEPGFYQGSYYVVYALGVAIFVTLWVATRVLVPSASFEVYLWVILSGIFISAPFTYPISKLVWANLFFHFKKDLQLSEKNNA